MSFSEVAQARRVLDEVERRSVTLSSAGDKLRFRPKDALTPELVEELKTHKEGILRILADREIAARDLRPVEDAGEIFEMARVRFGLPPEDREPPVPPPVRGRDHLVHRDTDKARFYREVRREDLEKRRREGLPPWIRMVDGGTGEARASP